MKNSFFTVAVVLFSCLSLGAGNALEDLPSADFLAEIRQPFSQDAWGEITGRLQYVVDGKRQKGNLRIRLIFAEDSLHAQVVVNEKNTYGYEQQHGAGQMPKTKLDLPEVEVFPGLKDFGLEPEDITFAFLYWKFVEELPAETLSRRKCRVFTLAHPGNKKGTVRVWFDASRGFPLQVKWFREGENESWRVLELKGVKKFDKDLWFIKEMHLRGAEKEWKTQIRFDHAEINPVEAVEEPVKKKK